jgi:hypothetical protein
MLNAVEAVAEQVLTTHLTDVYGEADPIVVQSVAAIIVSSDPSFNSCYGGIVKTIYGFYMDSPKAHQAAKRIYDDFFIYGDTE